MKWVLAIKERFIQWHSKFNPMLFKAWVTTFIFGLIFLFTRLGDDSRGDENALWELRVFFLIAATNMLLGLALMYQDLFMPKGPGKWAMLQRWMFCFMAPVTILGLGYFAWVWIV